VLVTVPAGVSWSLVVVDAAGRRVEEATGVGTASEQLVPVRFSMETGARPGTYFARLAADGHREVQRFVLLGASNIHR
jgi:hypothetical protein